jgi:hypothetical protein
MTSTTDHRKAAQDRINDLIATLLTQPATPARDALVEECAALARAIGAFHIEGIRFRMFNVDRTLTRESMSLPPEARETFAAARQHLEAAGFHTRSH